MQPIVLNIKYAGAEIDTQIFPEENLRGMLYPVEMNENYVFTIFQTEEDEWGIMREPNGNTPFIENELYETVIKKLRHELQYAA